MSGFFALRGGRNGGFTLIEMLVSIAIMVIIVGTVFVNYGSFTSHSLLRIRVDELGEHIRFAQERSGSAETFLQNTTLTTRGFQVVRMKVRDGILENFRLEKAAGPFTGFSEGTNFAIGRDSTVSGSATVLLEANERYFVDVCFIDTESQRRYNREQLILKNDLNCSSDSMLCSTPNPSEVGYDAAKTARNNFDIHLSIEQPTREVYANVMPVVGSTYVYGATVPNGASGRVSDMYEGVRIVFIATTGSGAIRSIDIYKTGLVSTRAKDTYDGCNEPTQINSGNQQTLGNTLNGELNEGLNEGFNGGI